MSTRIRSPLASRLADTDRRQLLQGVLDLADEPKPAPPLAAWKAWAFAGWVLVAAAAYALSMLSSL